MEGFWPLPMNNENPNFCRCFLRVICVEGEGGQKMPKTYVHFKSMPPLSDFELNIKVRTYLRSFRFTEKKNRNRFEFPEKQVVNFEFVFEKNESL